MFHSAYRKGGMGELLHGRLEKCVTFCNIVACSAYVWWLFLLMLFFAFFCMCVLMSYHTVCGKWVWNSTFCWLLSSRRRQPHPVVGTRKERWNNSIWQIQFGISDLYEKSSPPPPTLPSSRFWSLLHPSKRGSGKRRGVWAGVKCTTHFTRATGGMNWKRTNWYHSVASIMNVGCFM